MFFGLRSFLVSVHCLPKREVCIVQFFFFVLNNNFLEGFYFSFKGKGLIGRESSQIRLKFFLYCLYHSKDLHTFISARYCRSCFCLSIDLVF